MAQLMQIIRTALNPQEREDTRIRALQKFHNHLLQANGFQSLLGQLPVLWPQVVRLLWDPLPAVSGAAVSVLGLLGALVMSPNGLPDHPGIQETTAGSRPIPVSPGQAPPTLVLDWGLPLLSAGDGSLGGPPGLYQHSMKVMVLRVLIRTSQLVGHDRLRFHARRIVPILRDLLEEESTPVEMLPPVLDLLHLCVLADPGCVMGIFNDLVDLLIGWALEPALPAEARPSVSRVFRACRPAWQHHREFTLHLVKNMTADLDGLQRNTNLGTQADSLSRFLSLLNCLVSIILSCGPPMASDFLQYFPMLLDTISKAAVTSGRARSPLLAQACAHVQALLAGLMACVRDPGFTVTAAVQTAVEAKPVQLKVATSEAPPAGAAVQIPEESHKEDRPVGEMGTGPGVEMPILGEVGMVEAESAVTTGDASAGLVHRHDSADAGFVKVSAEAARTGDGGSGRDAVTGACQDDADEGKEGAEEVTTLGVNNIARQPQTGVVPVDLVQREANGVCDGLPGHHQPDAVEKEDSVHGGSEHDGLVSHLNSLGGGEKEVAVSITLDTGQPPPVDTGQSINPGQLATTGVQGSHGATTLALCHKTIFTPSTWTAEAVAAWLCGHTLVFVCDALRSERLSEDAICALLGLDTLVVLSLATRGEHVCAMASGMLRAVHLEAVHPFSSYRLSRKARISAAAGKLLHALLSFPSALQASVLHLLLCELEELMAFLHSHTAGRLVTMPRDVLLSTRETHPTIAAHTSVHAAHQAAKPAAESLPPIMESIDVDELLRLSRLRRSRARASAGTQSPTGVMQSQGCKAGRAGMEAAGESMYSGVPAHDTLVGSGAGAEIQQQQAEQCSVVKLGKHECHVPVMEHGGMSALNSNEGIVTPCRGESDNAETSGFLSAKLDGVNGDAEAQYALHLPLEHLLPVQLSQLAAMDLAILTGVMQQGLFTLPSVCILGERTQQLVLTGQLPESGGLATMVFDLVRQSVTARVRKVAATTVLPTSGSTAGLVLAEQATERAEGQDAGQAQGNSQPVQQVPRSTPQGQGEVGGVQVQSQKKMTSILESATNTVVASSSGLSWMRESRAVICRHLAFLDAVFKAGMLMESEEQLLEHLCTFLCCPELRQGCSWLNAPMSHVINVLETASRSNTAAVRALAVKLVADVTQLAESGLSISREQWLRLLAVVTSRVMDTSAEVGQEATAVLARLSPGLVTFGSQPGTVDEVALSQLAAQVERLQDPAAGFAFRPDQLVAVFGQLFQIGSVALHSRGAAPAPPLTSMAQALDRVQQTLSPQPTAPAGSSSSSAPTGDKVPASSAAPRSTDLFGGRASATPADRLRSTASHPAAAAADFATPAGRQLAESDVTQELHGVQTSAATSADAKGNSDVERRPEEGVSVSGAPAGIRASLASAPGLGVQAAGGGSDAFWALSQHSAMYCVQSRMRTHFGGPTQSFAGLEKLLQGVYKRLEGLSRAGQRAQAADESARPGAVVAGAIHWGGGTPLPSKLVVSCWLMLEFFLGLERGIWNASTGSHSGSQPSKPAVIFFAGNSKVCGEWFARQRELLLRIAALTGLPGHALLHGWQRLSHLQAQMTILLKARKKSAASFAAKVAAPAPLSASTVTSKPNTTGSMTALGSGRSGGVKPHAAGKGDKTRVRDGGGGNEGDARGEEAQKKLLKPRGGESGPADTGKLGESMPGADDTALDARLSKLALNVVEVLKLVSLALCAQHEGESVHGLQSWACSAFKPLLQHLGVVSADVSDGSPHVFDWLLGVCAQAMGRYELAVPTYQRYLLSPISRHSLGLAAHEFCRARIAECYGATADWQGLHTFFERVCEHEPESPWVASTQAAVLAGYTTLDMTLDVNEEARGGPSGTGEGLTLISTSDALRAIGLPQSLKDDEFYNSVPGVEGAVLRALRSTVMENGSGAGGNTRLDLLRAAWQSDREACLEAVQKLGGTCLQTQLNAATFVAAGGFLGVLRDRLSADQLQLPITLPDSVVMSSGPNSVKSVITDSMCVEPASWLRYPGVKLLSGGLHLLKHSFPSQPEPNGTAAPDRAASAGLLGLLQDGKVGESVLFEDTKPLVDLLRVDLLLRLERVDGGRVGPVMLQLLQSAHAAGCWDLCLKVLALTRKRLSSYGGNAQQADTALLEAYEGYVEYGSTGEAAPQLLVRRLLPLVKPYLVSTDIWPADALQQAAVDESAGARRTLHLALSELMLCAAEAIDRTTEEDVDSISAGVDWKSICSSGQQVLRERAGHASAGNLNKLDIELPAKEGARQACLVGALVYNPGLAAAWKLYGDFLLRMAPDLHRAAAMDEPKAPSGHTATARRPAPCTSASTTDAVAAYLLAVDAYCQCMAAGGGPPEQQQEVLLKVLQVLVRHGQALQSKLFSLLDVCPPDAWTPLVPQLFAQLCHASPAVRPTLQTLLSQVGTHHPSAILYPALGEVRMAVQAGTTPQQEHVSLLRDLEVAHPGVVNEAWVMCSEMERCVVWAEERWYTLLSETEVDVMRRLVSLQAEAARVGDNQNLTEEVRKGIMADRYATLMAPAVLALERHLREAQAATPSTPHEAQFASSFLPELQKAVEAFKHLRKHDYTDMQACWSPLKALASRMAQHLGQPHIRLAHISPRLAQLSSTAVPMPGDDPSCTATVVSVHPSVSVLATKTRPKKLMLLGSDGRQYVYLLKGREDLRMDQRLMQVLSVVNLCLQSRTSSRRLQLKARHYSITPLADRVGLIQWVQDTASLFSIFSSWQKNTIERHTALVAAARAGVAGAEGTAVGASADPVLAPMAGCKRLVHLFFTRLMPALHEAGVSRMAARKQWPVSVLRAVLQSLIADAPKDLFSREIWAGAHHVAAWCSRQRKYNASMAVMSIMGWLLGIGDRHLDNVLLDLNTAEVVHIDYNVCFDKGRKLRVPEVVPFRLTHTLQHALGVTGTEGAFRHGCEAVLQVVRDNSVLLVSLLDAILHDPLVEWAAEREDSAARMDLELAVSLNLFVSRVDELSTPLHQQVSRALPTLSAGVNAIFVFADVHSYLASLVLTRLQAQQQLDDAQATIRAAAEAEQHQLTRIAAAVEAEKQLMSQIVGLTTTVDDMLKECQRWGSRQDHTILSLRGHSIPELEAPPATWQSVLSPDPIILLSATDRRGAVVDPRERGLLTQALGPVLSTGHVPAAILDQCRAIDVRAMQLLGEREQVVTEGMAALLQYKLILQHLLPNNYQYSSHHHCWAQAFTALLTPATRQQDALAAAAAQIPKQPGTADVRRGWVALAQSRQALADSSLFLTPLVKSADLSSKEMVAGQILERVSQLLGGVAEMQKGDSGEGAQQAESVRGDGSLGWAGEERNEEVDRVAQLKAKAVAEGIEVLCVQLMSEVEAVVKLLKVTVHSNLALQSCAQTPSASEQLSSSKTAETEHRDDNGIAKQLSDRPASPAQDDLSTNVLLKSPAGSAVLLASKGRHDLQLESKDQDAEPATSALHENESRNRVQQGAEGIARSKNESGDAGAVHTSEEVAEPEGVHGGEAKDRDRKEGDVQEAGADRNDGQDVSQAASTRQTRPAEAADSAEAGANGEVNKTRGGWDQQDMEAVGTAMDNLLLKLQGLTHVLHLLPICGVTAFSPPHSDTSATSSSWPWLSTCVGTLEKLTGLLISAQYTVLPGLVGHIGHQSGLGFLSPWARHMASCWEDIAALMKGATEIDQRKEQLAELVATYEERSEALEAALLTVDMAAVEGREEEADQQGDTAVDNERKQLQKNLQELQAAWATRETTVSSLLAESAALPNQLAAVLHRLASGGPAAPNPADMQQLIQQPPGPALYHARQSVTGLMRVVQQAFSVIQTIPTDRNPSTCSASLQDLLSLPQDLQRWECDILHAYALHNLLNSVSTEPQTQSQRAMKAAQPLQPAKMIETLLGMMQGYVWYEFAKRAEQLIMPGLDELVQQARAVMGKERGIHNQIMEPGREHLDEGGRAEMETGTAEKGESNQEGRDGALSVQNSHLSTKPGDGRESGQDQVSDQEQQTELHAAGEVEAPDLVKFDWFDHGLAGADEMLEEEAEDEEDMEKDEGGQGLEDHCGPNNRADNEGADLGFGHDLSTGMEALEAGQDSFFGPVEPGLDEPLETGQNSFFGDLDGELNDPLEPEQDSFFGNLADVSEALEQESLGSEQAALSLDVLAAKALPVVDTETSRLVEALSGELSQALQACCLHLGELEQQRTFAAAVASAASQTRAAHSLALHLLALTEWMYEPLLSSDLSQAVSDVVGPPSSKSPISKAISGGISSADSVVAMPDRSAAGAAASKLSPLQESRETLQGSAVDPLELFPKGESHPEVAAYKALLMSADTSPGKAYISFFQHAHPDLKHLEMPSRTQLLAQLRRLARRYGALEEDLGAWQSQGNLVLQQVFDLLLSTAGGLPPANAAIISSVLSGLMRRRSDWLTGSRAHAVRVQQLGEEVLQLESAREGKYWSEGAGIELDAFAGYHELLSQLQGVSETLGAAQAEEVAARQAVEQLRVKVVEAESTIEALQLEEAGMTAGLELQAGLLVGKAAELEAVLQDFHLTILERLPLFCVDLGKLLKELCLATERQPSARDVHAMARRALTHHAQLLHTFRAMKPLCLKMQQALGSINEAAPFPPGLGIDTLLSGVLMPPTWTAARANQLMDGMAPCVTELQPVLPNLLQAPVVVQQLCEELESLEGAASHVALAIQSHHALNEQGPAASTPPGPSATQPTPALSSVITTGGNTTIAGGSTAGGNTTIAGGSITGQVRPPPSDQDAKQPANVTKEPGKDATSSVKPTQSTAEPHHLVPHSSHSFSVLGATAMPTTSTTVAAPESGENSLSSHQTAAVSEVPTALPPGSKTAVNDSVLPAVGPARQDAIHTPAASANSAEDGADFHTTPSSSLQAAEDLASSTGQQQSDAAATHVFHFGSVVPELLSQPEPSGSSGRITPGPDSSASPATEILPISLSRTMPHNQDAQLLAVMVGQPPSQATFDHGRQSPVVFGIGRAPSPALPPPINPLAFPAWYQPPPQAATLGAPGPVLQHNAAVTPSTSSETRLTVHNPLTTSTVPVGPHASAVGQAAAGLTNIHGSNSVTISPRPLLGAWSKPAALGAVPDAPLIQSSSHSEAMAPGGPNTHSSGATTQSGNTISNAPTTAIQPDAAPAMDDLVFGTWGVGGPRMRAVRPSQTTAGSTAEPGAKLIAGSAMSRQRGETLRARRGGVDVDERRKAYVNSLLKKCVQKIEGKDTELATVISVPDQVEALIQQASSLDNLCRMYEGWTPWI